MRNYILALAVLGSQVGMSQTFSLGEFPSLNQRIAVVTTVEKSPTLGTRNLNECIVYIDWRSSYLKYLKKNLENLGYVVTERKPDAGFLVEARTQFILSENKTHVPLFTGTSLTTIRNTKTGLISQKMTEVTRHEIKVWFKSEFPACKEL